MFIFLLYVYISSPALSGIPTIDSKHKIPVPKGWYVQLNDGRHCFGVPPLMIGGPLFFLDLCPHSLAHNAIISFF